MDILTLQAFLMWCAIINIGLLLFWAAMLLVAPDLVYRIQRRWFPLSKENFLVFMYGFLGLFKLLVIVFNIVPYIALLMIG